MKKPEVILELFKIYFDLICEVKLIENEDILNLLAGGFDVRGDVLNEVTPEITDCINNTFIAITLFENIKDNYTDLRTSHKEIELFIDNVNLEKVLLTINKKDSKRIISARSLRKIEQEFKDRLDSEYPINKFIFENLPLPILKEIDNFTEKRIKQFYKRSIAKNIFNILKKVNIPENKKHGIIGVCFGLLGLIATKEQYLRDYSQKTGMTITNNMDLYSDYYKNYIIEQARNTLKSK